MLVVYYETMADVRIQPDVQTVAELAAAEAWRVLTNAIAEHGEAVWVLAGGTAPLAAYRVLAEKYANRIDWSHVYAVIGDERCVPFESPDSNWGQITKMLLDPLGVPPKNRLMPRVDLTPPELVAKDYMQVLSLLPKAPNGMPRFDLMWLGVGEDGHTLSLFPGRPEANAPEFVVAVHESPKPPADRITLTLAALGGAQVCNILSTGAGKATAIGRALQDDMTVPVARVAKVITNAGGKVTWMLDAQAAGSSTVVSTRGDTPVAA